MPLFPSANPKFKYKGPLTAAGLPKDPIKMPSPSSTYRYAFNPEDAKKGIGRDTAHFADFFIKSIGKLEKNLKNIELNITVFESRPVSSPATATSTTMGVKHSALLADAKNSIKKMQNHLEEIDKLHKIPANDRMQALNTVNKIEIETEKLAFENRLLNSNLSRIDDIKNTSLKHFLGENNTHVSSSEKSITNLGNAIVSEQDKIIGHAQKSIEKPFESAGKTWAHMCKVLASTVHPKLGDPPKF